MIAVKIISTPAALERLRNRGEFIIAALIKKTDQLMVRLQAKVVGEKIPQFFQTYSNIASTVQMIPAHLEGRSIVGTVQAGGPKTTKITLKNGREVDYAAVQEFGVAHGWKITPFNKQALRFFIDGKAMIRRSVFITGLQARPFMRSSLEEMTPEIIAGLEQAFRESLEG